MGDTRLGSCDMDSRVVAEESGRPTALSVFERTFIFGLNFALIPRRFLPGLLFIQ